MPGNHKYSLHNLSNRNGYLTDFTIENRLTCLNRNFQKRVGKLWTYTYAINTQAQIDHVFINKKWKNSTVNCEAYSSFKGVSTDHQIFTAKIQLDPNKFSVFFNTKNFNFLVIPFSDTGIIISPSNFILSPVTVRAVLLVIFIIGLFNFLQVCKFIIDRSEPESN